MRCIPLAGALWLTGCLAYPSVAERQSTADGLAAAQGWQRHDLRANEFRLTAWYPAITNVSPMLTVYIEGDGFSWLTRTISSSDPTPVTPIGLQLALAQPHGTAAYLARPCQYPEADDPPCAPRYWMEARFAPETIAAMNTGVTMLKIQFHAEKLILVGYSGGGTVAALLAERRNDVAQLITVAGNLDTGKWVNQHQLSPLVGSLNPADTKSNLRYTPQIHFVGLDDLTFPPNMPSTFVDGMNNATVIPMPGFNHTCCWAQNWSTLWKMH